MFRRLIDARGVLQQVLIVRSQQAADMEHSSECPYREGPAAESEEVDAIPRPVMPHEIGVQLDEVVDETDAKGELFQVANPPAQARPARGKRKRADARVVARDLLRNLLGRRRNSMRKLR